MVVPRSLPTSHRFGSVTARTLALAVVTLALTSLLADQAPLLAQSVSQVINYAPSDEDFPNPERGFYYQRLFEEGDDVAVGAEQRFELIDV